MGDLRAKAAVTSVVGREELKSGCIDMCLGDKNKDMVI